MKAFVGTRSRFLACAAGVALAVTIGVRVAPARAAGGGILGDVGQVATFASAVQKFYDGFNEYILGQKPPSDLEKIKAAIIQSQNAIVSQIDAIASAQVQACAATAVEQFENIDTMSTDTLQGFAHDSVNCVNTAAFDIDAETDKGAIDRIGFALNIIGPIALFASADANQHTDVLTQSLILANQHLMTKLTPNCDNSILNPNDLPSFGYGPITGHGACYNYNHPTPPPVANYTTYIPGGPNVAFLPWYLRGQAIPRDDLIPSQGYFVQWPWTACPGCTRSPGTPQEDFSIAIDQVMAATSYPIADAALYGLLQPIRAPGSAIAAAASTVGYAPVEALRVNSDGSVSRDEVHHDDETLSGWTGMDGRLQSLAEASNADGRVEMFGVDRVGHVFHRWQEVANDDTSWSPWAQLTGQILNSIAVARNHDGTLQLFGTTPSGAIFTRNQVLTRDAFQTSQPVDPAPAIDDWTDWKQMNGALTQVAAGANANGQVELFGINSAGNVFDREQTAPNATDPSVAGSWTAWHLLDGTLRSIAVTRDLGGSLNILGTGLLGTVWQRFQLGQNTEQWSAWTGIPAPRMGNVAAAMESGGGKRIDLLGLDIAGHIYLNSNDGIHGDAWRGWTLVPDTPAMAPTVVSPGAQSTSLGAQVNLSLSVSGGTAPYTISMTGLPAGLGHSYNQIVGTPSSVGTFTVSVNATDAVGESGTTSFTWKINAVTVPNVLSQSRTDATGTLTALGLLAAVSYQKACIDPGAVLVQNPSAGAVVAPGSTIRLTVDSGTPSTCIQK